MNKLQTVLDIVRKAKPHGRAGRDHNMYRHGMCGTRPYRIWKGMVSRCQNKNRRSYHDYGGRGIKVCDRWLDFENFWSDMQSTYADSLQIDRIDVSGDYCPENCKWSTVDEQAKNKRNTIRYEFNGELLTVKEIAALTGVNHHTILYRLKNGWNAPGAFSTPVKKAAGVSYDHSRKKWKAYAKHKMLGRFNTKKEALAARRRFISC